MKQYPYTVQANSESYLDVGGNFIRVDSSAATVKVIAESMDGRMIADLNMAQGKQVSLPERYEKVRVKNETASSVTVVLELGSGEVSDNELTGTITASLGTSLSNANHTVGVAAALLLAANSAARSIIIQNNAASGDIYIGDDATVTTANGLKVSAGKTLTIDKAPQAAIYAIGSLASLDCRTLSELN